jgi:hypothetical protein
VVHIIPDPPVLEKLLMGIDDVKAHTLNAKISCLREELTQAITESVRPYLFILQNDNCRCKST